MTTFRKIAYFFLFNAFCDNIYQITQNDLILNSTPENRL